MNLAYVVPNEIWDASTIVILEPFEWLKDYSIVKIELEKIVIPDEKIQPIFYRLHFIHSTEYRISRFSCNTIDIKDAQIIYIFNKTNDLYFLAITDYKQNDWTHYYRIIEETMVVFKETIHLTMNLLALNIKVQDKYDII